MSAPKRFWVRYVAAIVMDGGFNARSEGFTTFMDQLAEATLRHVDLSHTAVLSPADGRIVLTTVVTAVDKNSALLKSLAAFNKCIEEAGWNSNMNRDGGDLVELTSVTASLSDDPAGQPQVEELAGVGS